MKHTLKAKNLAKVGKMKLVDKIQKAADDNGDPENAAKDLKNLLTKEESTRAWGKHNTWVKNQSEAEQEAHKKKSKGEKGQTVALFLLKKEAKTFQGWAQIVNAQTSLGQREVWTSEAKLVKEHGKEEFDAHVASGRIRWIAGRRTWCRTSYSRGQEYMAEQADDEAWDALVSRDLQGHLTCSQEGRGKGRLPCLKAKAKARTKERMSLCPLKMAASMSRPKKRPWQKPSPKPRLLATMWPLPFRTWRMP